MNGLLGLEIRDSAKLTRTGVVEKMEGQQQPRRFDIVFADELYFRYRERYASNSYAYKYLLTVILENLDSNADVDAVIQSLDGFADRYCAPLPVEKKSNVS